MAADPGAVHDSRWDNAWRTVAARLDDALPATTLDAELARTAAMAVAPPEEMLHRGAGWGALEDHRRRRAGAAPGHDAGLVFDDASLGDAQAPWLALLRDGALPDGDPASVPGAWMVQAEWRELLEQAVAAGKGAHWLAWLHLGVMRYRAGELPGARAAWEESLRHARTAWGLRCLAVLEQQAGEAVAAARLWGEACRLAPDLLQLAVECGQALLAAGLASEWIDLLAAMPPALRGHGRIRYLESRARLAGGEYDAAEAILRDDLVVEDFQEGESSLTDLWFEVQAQRLAARQGRAVDEALRLRVRRECPPPRHLDFRGQSS
jgi:tetratricopeptide (TPR) repeat protein